MSVRIQNFGTTAKELSRSPLGIIALFIVFVYGFVSLITINSDAFTSMERLLLIVFLISFPVLVLFVFAWMVSNHSDKLYGPGDFKNEEHFLQLIKTARVTTSLGAATAEAQQATTEDGIKKIVELIRATQPVQAEYSEEWRNKILWVDDRPMDNNFERQAFEAMGLEFTLVLTTDEAFEKLSQNKFATIISDMGRVEGPREGYVLLDRLRKEGDQTPLFFYAGSNEREHKLETSEHDGQGCTNNPQELFEMVIKAVIRRQIG